MIKRILIIVNVLFLLVNAEAQSVDLIVKDSLKNKDYDFYRAKYQATKSLEISTFYANQWLAKAKVDNNFKQMALAYQAVMYKVEKQNRLSYTDSIVEVALKTKNDAHIGSAYLTKGTTYFDLKKYKVALDNYMVANEFILRTKDQYLIYKVKYTIAQTKLYLGYYEEAIALFTECLDYFEEENDRAYLNTIHSLGLCYNKTKRYDLCSQYNKVGIDLGKTFEMTEMEPYFTHSEGVNQYFLANYRTSIKLLKQSMPYIKQREDTASTIIALFYLGKNYTALKDTVKAIEYFTQVDLEISKTGYLRPDVRGNFELLIAHYQGTNDLKNELYYTKRLLKVDSLLNTNFRYLSTKINREYDTKTLLESKDLIEAKLQTNKIIYLTAIILLVIVVCYILFRHLKMSKKYKIIFQKMMQENKAEDQPSLNVACVEELDIAPDLVNNILKKLEDFEKDKKFMEKNMSSLKLAELLQTNAKYISKIIPKYRGKKTINYISDLKIECIIELLKTERKYRNYTNKGLAETAGFGSTQNFTIAFKSRTGISPTYFIKELKKRS